MDSDGQLETGNEQNHDNSQFGSDDRDNYEEGWEQKGQDGNIETREGEEVPTQDLGNVGEEEELFVDSKTEGIEPQMYGEEEGNEEGSEEGNEEGNDEEYVPVDTSPSKDGGMVFEGESDTLNSGFDATQILSSFEYGVERLIVFQQINQERNDVGLPEIELNIDYMNLVDVHCKEMAQHKYVSQFDTLGFKPYQRFGLEGCVDWINDLTIEFEYHEKINLENIEDVLLECHKQLFESDSRNQILDPYATHVSIGLSIDNKLIKYTEVYYHKYIAVNNYIPNDWYQEMPFHIQGTLFLENKGICGVHVSHDPPPTSIEPNVLSTLPNYLDHGKNDVGVIWPWELSFDPHNNSFVIPVHISSPERGYYYYKIYCDDMSSIPLSKEDGADYKFPTSTSFLVGAILLPHIEDMPNNMMEEELDDPTLSVEPLEMPKPITEICLLDGKSDLSRKYTEKLYGYPSDEGVAIQIGYYSKPGSTNFISSVGFRSSNEKDESDINIYVIPYNIMSSEEFPTQPEFYMYYEIDSQATSYITEIGMIYGDSHPPPNAKVYQLPLKYQTFVYTLSVDSNIVDSTTHTPISTLPSLIASDHLAAKASRHTNGTPSEPTESFAGVEFDSTSIKLLEEELREAMQENAILSKANDSHQKRIIQILKEIPEVYANLPHAEAEKKYNETLQVVSDCRSQHNIMIKNFESELVYQKRQYDDTLNRSEIVSSNFMLLVKEIAQRSINSRTGKPIPEKIIQQLLEADSKKNELLMDIRLKQLEILNKMKKIDRSLKEREQLAEGLHLIDFEQLKIENQALNEKIEERNEELHKLKKKNTTTVHILTHTREKLQFVEQNNQILRDRLAELTNSLSGLRDELTDIKQIRDKLRQRTEVLKVDQGFLQTKKLITDYDKRRIEINDLNNKILELQKKHTFLLTQFKKRSNTTI